MSEKFSGNDQGSIFFENGLHRRTSLYTEKNERRVINPPKGFIKLMNPLMYVFFVHQCHKPFDIPFLLIYPKRVFHTLQSDKLLRVYRQLYTLKSLINIINPIETGFSFYASF